jgi:hypothetical protein
MGEPVIILDANVLMKAVAVLCPAAQAEVHADPDQGLLVLEQVHADPTVPSWLRAISLRWRTGSTSFHSGPSNSA